MLWSTHLPALQDRGVHRTSHHKGEEKHCDEEVAAIDGWVLAGDNADMPIASRTCHSGRDMLMVSFMPGTERVCHSDAIL